MFARFFVVTALLINSLICFSSCNNGDGSFCPVDFSEYLNELKTTVDFGDVEISEENYDLLKEYLEFDPDHGAYDFEADLSGNEFVRYGFGSLHTLNRYMEWATHEDYLVQVLTKRLELLDAEKKLIQTYLKDYDESTGEAMRKLVKPTSRQEERSRAVGSSAVLAHRMVQRYSTVVSQLRNFLALPDYLENKYELNETLAIGNDNQTWIDSEDMYMSMTAFLHLGAIYQYLPEHLMYGLNYETTSGGELNAVQCAEIAMFALYRSRCVASVEWMELAESLLTTQQLSVPPSLEGREESDMTLDLASLLSKVSIQKHNREFNLEAPTDYESYASTYTTPITIEQLPEERMSVRYEEFLAHRGLYYSDGDRDRILVNDAQYTDLCMGNKFETPEMAKNLRCYYENKKHPYLYLNPVKTEQLSENPPIYQFYEMVDDKTINYIKETWGHLVMPSQVVGISGMDGVSVFRTSAGASMLHDEVPRKMFTLAEIVTGLKIFDNSEPTQYVEYTYGRCYVQHTDALETEEETADSVEKFGDRIATVLYYLEIPTEGGATPFCEAGIWTHLVKGSAILWFNLYKNGTARRDTGHGSCPVIHGHKIIMNHWVYHHGNWNHRKCSLNQFE